MLATPIKKNTLEYIGSYTQGSKRQKFQQETNLQKVITLALDNT